MVHPSRCCIKTLPEPEEVLNLGVDRGDEAGDGGLQLTLLSLQLSAPQLQLLSHSDRIGERELPRR